MKSLSTLLSSLVLLFALFGSAIAGETVNINTADEAALDELPGVGPVTAEAIVEYRNQVGSFSQVEDLLEVRGIGDAKLEALIDLVTV